MKQFKIVVFENRHIPFVFLLRRLALVDRTFKVVLLVQFDIGRDEVVHDHKTNVLVGALIAVETEKFR